MRSKYEAPSAERKHITQPPRG